METWTATKTEAAHWLFEWDGGSATTYYIWLRGILIDTVVGGEYDSAEPGYEDSPPPLEIVETEDAENELYPPFATLQWKAVVGANAYLVERYVSGAWTTVDVLSEIGVGYYWYRTEVLEDQTQEQFRVSTTDPKGNTGTPITFTFSITRNPTPPDIEYEIDSIGDLVVTET